MKRIYVSYRREDTSESYGRIVERLRAYFGAEATLRSDSAYTAEGATISPDDYRAYVASAMKSCAALLLLIGPHWGASAHPDGWRIADLDDPVRIEIEGALRAGVPVLPALVQQGRMPTAEELPASLRLLLEQGQERGRGRRRRESLLALVSRAGMQVRRDPDFGGDAQRLCEVLENLAGLEATSLERAGGAINRTVRNVTSLASAALIAHVAILAYFAYHVAIPLTPSLVIPTSWVPTVILTSLIDWGIYFLAGYVTGRRTGEAGLGVSAAVTGYVIGMLVEIAIFADITWSRWALFAAQIARPKLLSDAYDWIAGPSLLLMHPFILLFAILLLGIPIGLGASFALGSLGGILGARVTELLVAAQRNREREARMRDPSGARGLRALLQRDGAHRPAPPRRAAPAGKIFISYRRDDSAIMCGSIYDRLTEIFGLDTVFKDVDMIPVGVNFERFIETTLRQCVAQVVVIGPRWVSIASANGARRLDDPADFVRLEVESALKSGLTIIPVLVQGATMPAAEDLPESLRPLADLQPVTIRYAPAFDADMRDLGLALTPAVWPVSTRRSPLKRALSLRIGRGGTQAAAYFWLTAVTAYGVILGVEVVQGLAQWLALSRKQPLVTFVGVAPVILTLLALISGAHLGYHTGRTRRAFWLAWRATIAGCLALALTTQLHGLTVYSGAAIAIQDLPYRLTATVTVAVAAVIALGPGLMAALLGSASAAFLRRRRDRSELLSQGPAALQLLLDEADTGSGATITTALVTEFGRRALPAKRFRLQNQMLRPGALQRLRELTGERVRAVLCQRPLVLDPAIQARGRESRLLTAALKRSAALLVLVGPSWAAESGALSGMQDPEHPLRARVEAGLAVGKPVIPVLLAGATMPAPDQLPPSMREFALLNAAWVRDGADFPGDMRRLARVIERVTRLRKARNPIRSLLALFGGVVLSTLVLIAADALAARYVVSDYQTITQGALTLTGAALIVLDLIVAGLAGGLVTWWSGRRANGALAAMLGVGLAMLATADALRLAHGDLGGDWSHLAASLSGVATIPVATLDSIGLFLVAQIPFQTLGVAAAGALGAIYGRIAYRGRARAIQERLLHDMARVASGGSSLTEMSARSARITGAPASPSATTPLAAAPALATVDAPTAPTDEDTAIVSLPSEPDLEDTRRESLLGAIRTTRAVARRRLRVQLGALAGTMAILLLITVIAGRQVYTSELGLIRIDSAGANATATTQEQFAQEQALAAGYGPYFSLTPAGCEAGDSRANWKSTDPITGAVDCYDTYAHVLTNNEFGHHAAAQELTLNTAIPSTYSLVVTVTLSTPSTCAGLVSNGEKTQFNLAIGFEICANGTWRITYYKNLTFDVARLVSRITTRSLGSGRLTLGRTNLLQVSLTTSIARLLVNGRLIATVIDSRLSLPTVFVGICVSWGSSRSAVSAADFTRFSYEPGEFLFPSRAPIPADVTPASSSTAASSTRAALIALRQA
jgi:hypothetical protein